MGRTIPYDPTRRSLYKPCADAIELDSSATRSEALLCAEFSRLVYCAFENDAAIRQAIAAQLAAIGFGDLTFFNENGLQALLAVDPAKRLGILAFRGTQADELKDTLTNARAFLSPWAGSGCVHTGFANMLAGKWRDISAAIHARQGVRLLFTGHSLGAALATLSAALHRPEALYTFGSPRVGDAKFGASMTGVVHERYVDCSDIVCQIPDASWSYEHVGAMKYFDKDGLPRAGIADAAIHADQRKARLVYVFQYGWRQPANAFLRSFADHAPANYIHALRALA
jgi:Lipase (class 3)